MHRISVNLTNDCDGNQLNYNNDLPATGNKNYALQKPFKTDFSAVIGNAKLRPSFVICWVEVREAGTPHPRKKIETYLGIMGYLWALEWRKK